jgi:hypothetical protein
MRVASATRRRRSLGAARRTGDANWRFAQQAYYYVVAILLLDKHELAATRIGTLNSENAEEIAGHDESLMFPNRPEA